MLPRGLHRICVSTCALIHETNAALEGVVHESFIAKANVSPLAVTDDCGAR